MKNTTNKQTNKKKKPQTKQNKKEKETTANKHTKQKNRKKHPIWKKNSNTTFCCCCCYCCHVVNKQPRVQQYYLVIKESYNFVHVIEESRQSFRLLHYFCSGAYLEVFFFFAPDVLKSLIEGMYKSFEYCRKINGWQLAKMKKSIPDMSLPWNL